MYRLPLFVIIFSSMFVLFNHARADAILGSNAPDFELLDQKGAKQSLGHYRGQWVVLYFYPKNDTPGCTTEACQFRDDFAELKKLNVQIIGISIDNKESHAEFAEKYGLPFPLLADTEGTVAKQYGSLWSLGPIRFAKRHTFIIDPEGKIQKIYRDVNPKDHSREVITAVVELTGQS